MNRRKLLLEAPALILAPSLLLPKRALGGSVTLLGAGKPGGGGAVGVAPTLNGALTQAGGSGLSVVNAIATTVPNDIVVAYIFHSRVTGAGSPTTVSTVTDGILNTWAPKGSQVSAHIGGAGTPWVALDVYWLYAAAAQNLTVTVNFAAATDDCGLILAAVSGCGNTSNPWDANGSLPATSNQINNTTTVPTKSGISTTSPGTLITMFAYSANASAAAPSQTTGTGFTTVITSPASGGTNFSTGALETGPFTTAQSGFTAAFGTAWNDWITRTDALVGT